MSRRAKRQTEEEELLYVKEHTFLSPILIELEFLASVSHPELSKLAEGISDWTNHRRLHCRFGFSFVTVKITNELAYLSH